MSTAHMAVSATADRVRALVSRGVDEHWAFEIAWAEEELRRALRSRHLVRWPRCTDAQASAKERTRCRRLLARLYDLHEYVGTAPCSGPCSSSAPCDACTQESERRNEAQARRGA